MNREVGYGKRLQRAREASGLTVNEVADRLRLKVEVVLTLEQEDRQSQLAPAFVRGYLRNYSQLVSENADEIIQLYNQDAVADPALTQLDKIESASKDYSVMAGWLGTFAVVAIALFLLVAWWYWYSEAKPVMPDEPSDQALLEGSNESDLGPAADAIELDNFIPVYESEQPLDDLDHAVDDVMGTDEIADAPEAVGQIELDERAQPLANIKQIDTDTSTLPETMENEINPVAPEGNDRLELHFTGVSWIEVVDAPGYRLIYGLFDESDNPLSVQGQAPFQVIVGDANVVELTVNGQLYELRRHRRSNNTARVRLGDNNPNTE